MLYFIRFLSNARQPWAIYRPSIAIVLQSASVFKIVFVDEIQRAFYCPIRDIRFDERLAHTHAQF